MAEINESGVSPVVGVMLMLVVTIIVAAIVSAFAGSMGNTDIVTPKATITGTYSYSSDVFQLYHAGGDELSTQNIIIMVEANDEDFGGYTSLFSAKGTGLGLTIADKSNICNDLDLSVGTCWVDSSTGKSTLPVFRPGETMYLNESFSSNLAKLDPVGKSLILEVDTTDGHLISKSKVMIDP